MLDKVILSRAAFRLEATLTKQYNHLFLSFCDDLCFSVDLACVNGFGKGKLFLTGKKHANIKRSDLEKFAMLLCLKNR